MIAVHMLTCEEIAGRLEAIGCVKLDCDFQDTSYWKTPWDFHFFVPEIGPDLMCPDYKFAEIIREVESTRPGMC